jgi:hypothetical protein
VKQVLKLTLSPIEGHYYEGNNLFWIKFRHVNKPSLKKVSEVTLTSACIWRHTLTLGPQANFSRSAIDQAPRRLAASIDRHHQLGRDCIIVASVELL